jgi:hypothetical protein
MKINELLGEGLKASWTIQDVRDLTPKKLKALWQNAHKADDVDVLDMIAKITSERRLAAEVIADEQRDRAEEAQRQRKREKGAAVDAKKSDLEALGREIERVVGDTFPDGDPIDKLGPYVKRKFQCNSYEISDFLNKAAKTLGKYKDYGDYLAQTWDEYSVGYAEMNPDFDTTNPWK